ncbi:MAG TPA: hypothetical protein VFI52_09000 [Gemmatimonadaceae bacterium]|nr:hypothetical protein [Gemmatimonadaceae bacterium]
MTSSLRAGVACLGIALALLSSPAPAAAQDSGQVRQQSRQTMTEGIAAQLGAKLSPHQPEELPVGVSITASLTDSAKIAAFGATGLHAGARVTVMRIGPEKVRVEIDEMDPVPLTKKLTLRIDAQGRLIPPTP